MKLFRIFLTLTLVIVSYFSYAQIVPTSPVPTGVPTQNPTQVPINPPSTTTTNTQNPQTNSTASQTNGSETNDKPLTNDALDEEFEKQKFRENNQYYIDGLPIFGNAVFRGNTSTFAPNSNVPTPENYTVGPGDQMRIDVTGLSLKSWDNIVVQPDGSIFLDQLGKVFIGGNSWDDAKNIIINKLISHNVAIGRGSDATITLTNIRSIRISIIGEVAMQGDYTVSSLTTLFNALYLSGGIKPNGTYRAIEIRRNNELYRVVDVYKYLLDGDLSDNIQLRDGDVIVVPLYKIRVGITGEVKRPAMFEVVSGETLSDVIRFAGGFTEFAYPNIIETIQLTDRMKRVKTIELKDKDYYYPQNGDRYNIQRILDQYENRVSITGAVYRPGMFELESTPTLKTLIKKADGLKEDAFLDRAYITRQNPKDFSMEMLTIDLRGIMNGTMPDIVLQREDVVSISSIYEISDQTNVRIVGHVKNPTSAAYYPGITVEDLILKAGGLLDGAEFNKVQISRRVKDSDRMASDAKLAEIINISIDPYLRITDQKTLLQPYDVVTIFADPSYSKPITVIIEGEVYRPGSYSLLSKNEKLSSIVERSGGITESAYLKGATIRRQNTFSTNSERLLNDQRKGIRNYRNKVLDQKADGEIESSVNSSLDQSIEPQFVSINLEKALSNKGSKDDLVLQEGDVISIPSMKQTVRIVGEVNQPSIAVYEPGKSLGKYIYNNAGGFNELAHKKHVYVSYPNGATKGIGFWGNHPKIEPGCEIVVPFKEPREKKQFDVQTFTAISSTVASMAAIVLAIIRLSN